MKVAWPLKAPGNRVNMDQFNWTHREIDYLVNLTGIDCVRLKGTEKLLRNTAQKVHAKLKLVQQSRAPKGN
jgi:hypothetical protein